MNIVCIGGGPAGLYFALLMKKANPTHEITVIERNKPYDTFGWGVVFSDATMENMRIWDPETARDIEAAFNHWDDIEVRVHGRAMRTTGHGFVGIGRKRMLNILQARCEELDVKLVFEREVESDTEFPEADLIVATDGVNSRIRGQYADRFKPNIELRSNRYIWLGTEKIFDAFTFDFQQTSLGWFQAHIYKFDATHSTVIIETTEDTYQLHGLAELNQEQSLRFCEKLFSDVLDGAKLIANSRHQRGSAWLNFTRLICDGWRHFNGKSHVVLMGDAAHTAHFSIGAGTKLALEDAIELTRMFNTFGHKRASITTALARYEEARRVEVARIQNAARNAMEWFEDVGSRYVTLPPEQFMYSLLTRSQRISHENLRLRDPAYVEIFERWFANRAGVRVQSESASHMPMLTPFSLRGMRLENRIVMSPMAVYSAVEGVPSDFHMVHLGARALGGAALVFGEMTCVSADARITPGCCGLWNSEQAAAWRRITGFIHGNSSAKAALQLGHAGRKGSTRVAWEGMDKQLENGNWPLISASAVAYLKDGAVPRPMTPDDMARVTEDFVRSTRLGAEAGFDLLELHCTHGYLLSSFLSPLTNLRTDEFGGSLTNRARFPLAVFTAVRKVWPKEKPFSVRLSCSDWADGGTTPEEATQFARMFKEAGADLIDCSSGQVWHDDNPVYGRMYQTPFSDRIRNEVGIATIAVGAITDSDQCNSIISAGRADLCALARPHLSDPAWLLHEAAKMGVRTVPWPKQYVSGKQQYETLLSRQPAKPGAKR